MSFEEPTRRDPRLEQGRQYGGIYEGQANTADRQWAISCGVRLRSPRTKGVHLQRLSLRIWRREEADIAAREHRAALEVQHKHRATVEAEKSVGFQHFTSDMRKCHKKLGGLGLPHDKLVMTKLNEESVAIQCKHGIHIRCSHADRRQQGRQQ